MVTSDSAPHTLHARAIQEAIGFNALPWCCGRCTSVCHPAGSSLPTRAVARPLPLLASIPRSPWLLRKPMGGGRGGRRPAAGSRNPPRRVLRDYVSEDHTQGTKRGETTCSGCLVLVVVVVVAVVVVVVAVLDFVIVFVVVSVVFVAVAALGGGLAAALAIVVTVWFACDGGGDSGSVVVDDGLFLPLS